MDGSFHQEAVLDQVARKQQAVVGQRDELVAKRVRRPDGLELDATPNAVRDWRAATVRRAARGS